MKQIAIFLKKVLVTSIILSSCRNIKIKTTDKFLLAKAHYEKKEYSEAIILFRDVMQAMIGKSESVESKWFMGQCFFKNKNYQKSAVVFRDFYNNYPNNFYAEEALYLSIESLSEEAKYVSLDQRETKETIEAIEEYFDKFPYGNFKEKIETIYYRMVEKVDRKNINTAKIFFDLGYYNATLSLIDTIFDEIKTYEGLDEIVKIKTESLIELIKRNKKNFHKSSTANYLEFMERYKDKFGYDDGIYRKYIKKFWDEIPRLQ